MRKGRRQEEEEGSVRKGEKKEKKGKGETEREKTRRVRGV